MITGIKYIYNASLFWVHCKKHFCPRCGTKAELGYYKTVVNSKSYEAKFYDFYDACGDYMRGNIKFIIRCFYCPKCDFNISFEDMKKYERELKRRNKRNNKK